MTLSSLVKKPQSRQQPSETDIRKVSALLAENKRRAENILLSIKLSLPSEISRIDKLDKTDIYE